MNSANTAEKHTSRLSILLKREGMTKAQFAQNHGIAEKTVDSYLNGNRRVPLDNALEWAEKYHFSLDWFYGRTDFIDKNDVMANIVMSLGKVFRFSKETPTSESAMQIDRQFFNFVRELQKLENCKEYLTITANTDHSVHMQLQELCKVVRENIFSKYKDYFVEVFNCDDFDEKNSVRITDPEHISVIDLLSAALE